MIIEGGVGIEENVNIGGTLDVTNATNLSSTLDVANISTLGATTGVTISADGVLRVNNSTGSTDKDTGSVIIEGGVGIEENVNIGGTLDVADISTLGATTGVTISADGVLRVNNTTGSNNKDTGSVIIEGGVGIDCLLYTSPSPRD